MESFKNIKLVVLDNDDTLFRSSPQIQFHVNRLWPGKHSQEELEELETIISVLQYQYSEVLKAVAEARNLGVRPSLPDFSRLRNDVIKTKDDGEYFDFDYEYYDKPIEKLLRALNRAKRNLDMFLERRDVTLETDGKLSKEDDRVMPYHLIYLEGKDEWLGIEKWFEYVRENINDLYNIFGSRLISLTAHNGIDDDHGRELDAKGEAIHNMNPHIKHYGLRFHATEHVDGERRPRNSKALWLQKKFNLQDLEGVVVLEDSKVVLKDIKDNGGIPIFVNPNGAPNEEGYYMVKSIRAESVIRELNKIYGDGEEKVKSLKR